MKAALKIKPKRLADEAFELISTWIEAGRFVPGAHLSESSLCADLGISRTPLREALFKLESQGFVISRPNRGFFVAVPHQDIITNLTPILAALEGLALKSSPRFSEQQMARLKLINRDLNAAKGSHSLRFQLDMDFHAALIKPCPNPQLIDQIEAIGHQIQRFRVKSDQARASQGHQDIIGALEVGNNALAATLVEAHWLENNKKDPIRIPG